MRTDKHWKDILRALRDNVDLIIQIIDCRNPLGTHSKVIEEFVKREELNIKEVLVLNKSDMVPREVVHQWVSYFKKRNYTVFSASAKYSGGVRAILQLLRQMVREHKFREMNVLAIGYPNTGKSTIIESLTDNKKKLGVSSKAGFTRGIKRVKLSDKIFIIDSPGVIPFNEKDQTDMAIKAIMIADKLDDPLAAVEAIFKLLSFDELERVYKIQMETGDTAEELVEKVGRKMGRLISGGRVNEPEVQKLIIRDWQNNKLHFFHLPPNEEEA